MFLSCVKRTGEMFGANHIIELKQDTEYGSLQLTEKAYAVFRGEPVWGTMMSVELRESAAATTIAHDPDLFHILRTHRKALADAANVPPYVIFSDRTLVEMATYFPSHRRDSPPCTGWERPN